MTKFYKSMMSCTLGIFIAIGFSINVYAKPEINPLGANIADVGSKYYSFKVKEFKSNDKQRTYKVWLGIPHEITNPQKEYSSLCMLDGNSAMSHLDDNILKSLAEEDAPVLVAIGYKTNLPFESESRALDYTSADKALGKPAPDPRNPKRMSGGSADFRTVIVEDIAPWVEQNVKLDANKRAIWGHSYGGVFISEYAVY